MQAGFDNAYGVPGLPPTTDSPKACARCCAALSLEARMRSAARPSPPRPPPPGLGEITWSSREKTECFELV